MSECSGNCSSCSSKEKSEACELAAKLGRIKLLRSTLIVRKSSIPAPEVKKTERSGQTAPR